MKKLLKRRLLGGFTTVLVLGFAAPALAWETQQEASSSCERSTNNALVAAEFHNNEKNRSMDVSASAAGVDLGTQSVAAGASAEFSGVLGTAPQPGGEVAFVLTWTEGNNDASQTVTASYEAVEACVEEAKPETKPDKPEKPDKVKDKVKPKTIQKPNKVDEQVITQPQPTGGALPFTGTREAVWAGLGFFLIAAGLVLVRRPSE
jgi:outer membrane biosynthesis protein TonB